MLLTVASSKLQAKLFSSVLLSQYELATLIHTHLELENVIGYTLCSGQIECAMRLSFQKWGRAYIESEGKGKCVLVQTIEASKESRCIGVASIIVGGKEPGTHLKWAELLAAKPSWAFWRTEDLSFLHGVEPRTVRSITQAVHRLPFAAH